MPRDRLPSYRLHKPSGQAVVTINGRDFYLGKHGTPESRQQYERLIAEWLANGRRRPTSPAHATTIDQIIDAYMEYAHGYYRKNGKPTNQIERIKRSLRIVHSLYTLPHTRRRGII